MNARDMLALLHEVQSLWDKRLATMVEKGRMTKAEAAASTATMTDLVQQQSQIVALDQPAISAKLIGVLSDRDAATVWLRHEVSVDLCGRGVKARDILVRCSDNMLAEQVRQSIRALGWMADRGEVTDARALALLAWNVRTDETAHG